MIFFLIIFPPSHNGTGQENKNFYEKCVQSIHHLFIFYIFLYIQLFTSLHLFKKVQTGYKTGYTSY